VAATVKDRYGTWDDLVQVVGIAVEHHQWNQIVNLFDWSDKEKRYLENLSQGARGGLSLQSKQYKHLCYLFETAFAVAIEPNMNVTQNPTCEWQLKWYGNQLE
jgi:hypothetical protein